MTDDDDIPWKAKKPKEALIEDDIPFDSKEEQWFYWQLLELKELGAIATIDRCQPFQLSEKLSSNGKKKRTLLKPHLYTPDFCVTWNESELAGDVNDGKLFVFDSNKKSIFEVKPCFDASGTITKANINIKWVWEKYGVYVQLVNIGTKAGSWFDKSWTPRRFSITEKTKKQRALGFQPTFLDEALEKLIH